MSHFLRQFHLISSLKTNSERELNPFYKVIAPILSRHPVVRKIQTLSIKNNMKLKVIDPNDKGKKKLAIILSWLMAKETHVDKFRALYLSRGFDVLSIDSVPKDLLFPTSGSQVIATNILDYIKSNEQYDKIVVHAFSIGAYMLGEIFVKICGIGDEYRDVAKRISGVVVDSAVDLEGLPLGFPRSVSSNPITIKVLEWYATSHMALMYNVATKHYIKSSKHFHNTPLLCPALMYASETDKIGNPVTIRSVADKWESKGVDVRMKAFKDSSHVGHFRKYHDEYVEELDNFLKKVDRFS